MQAPLSSTASGKLFRTGSLTAFLPASAVGRSDKEQPRDPIDRMAARSFDTLEANPKSPLNTLSEGAGLAHDAGNLLGALGLYCELLALPGVLRREHRHYAEELRMLSGRSRELIDRLLDPTTTERRKAGLVPKNETERVVLPDVIDDCRGLLNAVARRAVTVVYEVGAALPVTVSRESLERILVNLTKNAAEATRKTEEREDEAAITLRVTCPRNGLEQERIVLTVEDNGCGMSTAAVKALLRKDNSNLAGTSSSGPRGIGFQVVRELVGASGGQLRLTSRSCCGTTVSIAWAVAKENKTNNAMDSAAKSESLHVPNPLEERRRLMTMARSGQVGRLSC